MEVCWDKSAAEKAYGMLGDCEEAKLGGELGTCLPARKVYMMSRRRPGC